MGRNGQRTTKETEGKYVGYRAEPQKKDCPTTLHMLTSRNLRTNILGDTEVQLRDTLDHFLWET